MAGNAVGHQASCLFFKNIVRFKKVNIIYIIYMERWIACVIHGRSIMCGVTYTHQLGATTQIMISRDGNILRLICRKSPLPSQERKKSQNFNHCFLLDLTFDINVFSVKAQHFVPVYHFLTILVSAYNWL